MEIKTKVGLCWLQIKNALRRKGIFYLSEQSVLSLLSLAQPDRLDDLAGGGQHPDEVDTICEVCNIVLLLRNRIKGTYFVSYDIE